MKIYIASSWKNQHAVEMLTDALRKTGNVVFSFVEKNFGELGIYGGGYQNATEYKIVEDWIGSSSGLQDFEFDTGAATTSDLVIYISPSGNDAAAEVGAAWSRGVPVFALCLKGESMGLMRRMFSIRFYNFEDLLREVWAMSESKKRKGGAL